MVNNDAKAHTGMFDGYPLPNPVQTILNCAKGIFPQTSGLLLLPVYVRANTSPRIHALHRYTLQITQVIVCQLQEL